MATDKGTLATLRTGATRLRKEGERLAARIEREVRTLSRRNRSEIAADVRKLQATLRDRADGAVRDIEKKGARIVGAVEKQVARTAEDVLKRIHGATQGDVAGLMRRVEQLEARVAALEGLSEGEESAV
jgi:hypothetical protein